MNNEGQPSGATELQDEILRLAIDAFAGHAFVTLDAAERITSWSFGAERLFGYTREQAVGSHASSLFSRAHRYWTLLREDMQRAQQHGPVSSRRRLEQDDGTVRSLEATVVTLGAGSQPIGYAILAREWTGASDGAETAREEHERLASLPAASNPTVLTSLRGRLLDLQHAVGARDEFIATVAHELRNPVAPLMFQLRLAIEKAEQLTSAKEPLPADWVLSQLRRIEQRLHRLLETLDRLLDVSRLSTGRIDLQPEVVSLGAVVREVVGSFEAELAVARCELIFDERTAATGWWDRVRLEQICRNLVSNAIRFGAGRPIEVVVEADQDFATLDVQDHGVGVAPDQQARIFERFERGLEPRSGGFGIGLWVVKSICAAMGGTISVESELGEGARFTVMLPRKRQRESSNTRSE